LEAKQPPISVPSTVNEIAEKQLILLAKSAFLSAFKPYLARFWVITDNPSLKNGTL
jgi:hypothetical protein